MEYKQLGKSNIQISKIGFGCMSLKGDYAALDKLLNTAIERGINYFDTADIYDSGRNETELGKTLTPFRKKIFIATKGGNQPKPDGSGLFWNPTKAYIMKACEDSLKRLKTDYIDLYQLHGGTIEDPIDETIEAFESLQQQGKIRHYGISSIRPNVIREYVKRSNIVSVMMQYSLLDRRPEEQCLNFLNEHKIGVLVRGSVAGGLLVDKPAKEYLGYSTTEVETMSNAVGSFSGRHRNKAQTSIQFVLKHRAVTAAVAGIRTLAQLEDALQTLQAEPLTQKEFSQLQNVLPVNQYKEHR
jgi:aryl-alcohol dehydrogenase-like predicted oxidoreductase